MSDQVASKVSVSLGPFVKNGSPKGGPFWSSFGVDFRTILRSILEPILEPFWEHFGADFGQFWSLCQLMSGIMFLLSLV